MKWTALENFIVLLRNVLILDLRPYFMLFSAIMFSLVSAQWTDERNSLHERTIHHLLQIKQLSSQLPWGSQSDFNEQGIDIVSGEIYGAKWLDTYYDVQI